MTAPARRPGVLKYVYNHNPFYAISASLMLYAILKAYGRLEIGTINSWVMMGVLAGYTSVLAVIGVLIVRWGKVWEDARSILLLLLLLFLAVSVSADDLFVRMKSENGATALLLCGYIFSAVVTEAVLRTARIRMGWRYRLSYHLMLALFYVAPWWCSPQFAERTQREIEWTLFLFPVAAAVLFLSLLPAVRGGARYAAENGTPWPWPLYPWLAFAVLAVAFSLRSFALTMTFGPRGPIWKSLESRTGIVFDTIWGPYFLVPLAFAILVLLLEMSLVAKDRWLQQQVLHWAPGLLLLCVPWLNGPTANSFLRAVRDTIGSPAWITVWLLIGFYAWAWLRRVRFAEWGVAGAVALFSFVDLHTTGFKTLAAAQAWPWFVAGGVLLVTGIGKRSAQRCLASTAVAGIGLWLILTDSSMAQHRVEIEYHFLLLAMLAIGLIFRNEFARFLCGVAAVQVPLVALYATVGSRAAEYPFPWRMGYVMLLAALALAIARLWRNRWFMQAFAVTTAVGGYGIGLWSFRSLVQVVGRPAVSAFYWSAAVLLLAFLISAHKAKWLPKRMLRRWDDGNGLAPVASTDGTPSDGGTAHPHR
jgi:hypothetical protein